MKETHPSKQLDRTHTLQSSAEVGVKRAVWFVTDIYGALLLRNLSKVDVMSKAPSMFKGYEFRIFEATEDHFGAILGELQVLLSEQEKVPVVIMIHCGAYYIGNKNYRRNAIKDLIVDQIAEVKATVLRNPKIQQENPDVKVIWSRMVAEPIESTIFSANTLYNSLKTVNSDAAAELFQKRIGILKHSKIEPNQKWFQPDGTPTVAAKLQFLMDIEKYIHEFEQFEELQASGRGPEITPKLKDNTQELRILEAEREQAELKQRMKLLEEQVHKSKAAEKSAKLQLEQVQKQAEMARKKRTENGPPKRPNTWAGRNNHKGEQTLQKSHPLEKCFSRNTQGTTNLGGLTRTCSEAGQTENSRSIMSALDKRMR